jgi:hypothetical protein
MSTQSIATIILPCGPGALSALDTLESVSYYCPERHDVVIIDDCTNDGTYDAIISAQKPNWHILRNDRRHGTARLVHTLSKAYSYCLKNLNSPLILRLDQDALVINSGVLTDALQFTMMNPDVGIFGVYDTDYNRPRSYDVHKRLIEKELSIIRRVFGIVPSWHRYLIEAENKGYRKGDNVFGGAYFLTRACLSAIEMAGALDVPYMWRSKMQEDVYYSMVTVASGYRMAHFAVPSGPMCLEWRGMPYPAITLWKRGYKIIHSVDKGSNTGPDDNDGKTAREVFRDIRNGMKNRIHID